MDVLGARKVPNKSLQPTTLLVTHLAEPGLRQPTLQVKPTVDLHGGILKRRRESICRDCGESASGYYRCRICYTKNSLSKVGASKDLVARRNELSVLLAPLELRESELEKEILAYSSRLEAGKSWWRKKFNVSVSDKKLDKLRSDRGKLLLGQLGNLLRELREVERKIKKRKKLEKQLRSACASKARSLDFERQRTQRHDRQVAASTTCVREFSYNRANYVVRKRDYKRGSKIENYFRDKQYDKVLRIFEGKCVNCDSTNDLTLDHFGIPKNEGGNYVLLSEANGAIQVNAIVLCRSCNSAKGERSFKHFWS